MAFSSLAGVVDVDNEWPCIALGEGIWEILSRADGWSPPLDTAVVELTSSEIVDVLENRVPWEDAVELRMDSVPWVNVDIPRATRSPEAGVKFGGGAMTGMLLGV